MTRLRHRQHQVGAWMCAVGVTGAASMIMAGARWAPVLAVPLAAAAGMMVYAGVVWMVGKIRPDDVITVPSWRVPPQRDQR